MSSREKKFRLLRLLYVEGCIDKDEFLYMRDRLKDEDKKEDPLPPPPVVH